MSAIVEMALSNAVLATAATPLVWVIGRLARKPVLAHALWLIVLFKLLTPPLWTWDVRLPSPNRAVGAGKVIELPPTVTPAPMPVVEVRDEAVIPQSSEPIAVESPGGNAPVVSSISAPPAHAAQAVAERIDWWAIAPPALGLLWAVGTVLCLAMALIRSIRFARGLAWATAAPDAVQARADALARSVGLEYAPVVQFIPGPLCPMLWPVGRSARLLVPSELWDRLDAVQRDTVLLHELAHWARRDHWVRWAELLATSLYWWLPACWVVRRELRRAEEQCCDAWVMWALPGSFQQYAHALLRAVEFVSTPADRPSALGATPALASGMGQFSDLKGRLTMLKHGNISRALSWGGLTVVFGLGTLLLPISPTIGQDAPLSAPAADQPAAKPGADVTPSAAPAPEATTEPQNPQPKPTVSKEPALDRSFYEKLQQMNVLPSQDATDAQYIRRLYLDLVGMPPSEERIRQFVDDPVPSAEKRKALLDKLLAGTPAGAHERALRDSQKRIDELVRQLDQANARIAALKAQADSLAKEREGFLFRDGTPSNGAPGRTRTELKTSPPANQWPDGEKRYGGVGTPPADNQGQPFDQPGSRVGGYRQSTTSIQPGAVASGAGIPEDAGPTAQKGMGDYRQHLNADRSYSGGDSAQRLDRLEAELKLMLREIDAFRAERQGAKTAAPSREDPTSVQPEQQLAK